MSTTSICRWRWQRTTSGWCRKNPGTAGSEPEWLAARVGSRCLRLDRGHQHDRFFADHIREFTADNNQLLGEYFGSRSRAGPFITSRTLPTTRTHLAKSPPAPTSSRRAHSRQSLPAMATDNGRTTNTCSRAVARNRSRPPSAGRAAPLIHPGRHPASQFLDPNERAKIAFLEEGYLVKGLPPDQPPTPNPIQEGTTILKIIDRAAGTVKLSKPLLHSSDELRVRVHPARRRLRLRRHDQALVFLGTILPRALEGPDAGRPHRSDADHRVHREEYGDDVLSTKRIPSWSKAWRSPAQVWTTPRPRMGIHQGDAVILQITTDKKSVILSQVANQSSTKRAFHRPPSAIAALDPHRGRRPGVSADR